MKSSISVELYGQPGNNAIVRLPGRKNQGVVLQADTLVEFARQTRRIANLARSQSASAELADDAVYLADQVDDLVSKLRSEVTKAGETLDV